MSVLIFWVASFAAAGCFVLAGYYFASWSKKGEPAGYGVGAGEVDRLRAQLAEAEKAREEAESRAAAADRGGASDLELAKLKSELTASRKQASEQETKVAQLEQSLDAQRRQVDQGKQSQQKIAELEQSVKKLTAERDEATVKAENLEAAMDGGTTQVQPASNAQVEALRVELEQSKKDQSAAKKQLEAAKKQLESLRKRTLVGKAPAPSAADTKKVKELEAKLEETKKRAEAQRQELMDYRRQIDELEEKHNKPSTKVGVKDPQQALRDAQADLRMSRAELDRARSRIEQLEGEVDDLRTEEPTKIKQIASAELVATDLKDALGATQTELLKAQGELEAERTKIAQVRKQAEDLEKQLEEQQSLKTVTMDQQQALAAADGKLRKLEEVEEERIRLSQENKALQTEITELNKLKELADDYEALKLDMATLKRKSDEAEKLREEKAQLGEQLQAIERERKDLKDEVSGFKEAQDDRTDLALKINVLTEQLRDLERMRDEQIDLKAKAERADTLEEQIAKLREENDNLRSMGLVKAEAPAPPVIDAAEGDEGLGGSLQRVIGRLTKEKGARAAVLADELGLVVAGVGESVDAMAALSAVFSEMNAKIRGALPLGTLRQITLTDENELTFAAQPYMTAEGRLVLATLLTGAAPDWKTIDEWISAAVKS